MAVISTASGTPSGVKVLRLPSAVDALAVNGDRVAYDLHAPTPRPRSHGHPENRVIVWNVATGALKTVSGHQTAGADSSAGGVNRLAIAGTQVAWRITAFGDNEADDDLYSSSLRAPRERHVAGAVRSGAPCGAGGGTSPIPACAGTWFGGVVAAGSKLLVNRWTTDTTGAITGGGLYTLHGTQLTPFADGGAAVEAVAADAQRIAVEQWRWHTPDPTINVLSASGQLVSTVTPAVLPQGIAMSGRNLLVLEPHGKLVLYDAATGALRKTFTLHKGWQAEAIAVVGNVAVYASPATPRRENSVRALNLTTGKDRYVGGLPGEIQQLRMDSVGLVYANYNYTLHGDDVRLVFRPFAQVAAAVR